MARLAADEMIDIVRDMLGGETTETISDTRVLRYLNQSYLQICSQFPFDHLGSSTTITTSSGTATYELSVDTVLSIDDILDTTTDLKLYPMNDKQYNQYTQGGTAQTGTPIYWFVDGVGSNGRWNITFWPTPSSTLSMSVDFRKKPTELTTTPSATSTIIPEMWDDSIIYRAAARGWEQLGDSKRAEDLRKAIKENDRAAFRSSFHPSSIGTPLRSIVGGAGR